MIRDRRLRLDGGIPRCRGGRLIRAVRSAPSPRFEAARKPLLRVGVEASTRCCRHVFPSRYSIRTARAPVRGGLRQQAVNCERPTLCPAESAELAEQRVSLARIFDAFCTARVALGVAGEAGSEPYLGPLDSTASTSDQAAIYGRALVLKSYAAGLHIAVQGLFDLGGDRRPPDPWCAEMTAQSAGDQLAPPLFFVIFFFFFLVCTRRSAGRLHRANAPAHRLGGGVASRSVVKARKKPGSAEHSGVEDSNSSKVGNRFSTGALRARLPGAQQAGGLAACLSRSVVWLRRESRSQASSLRCPASARRAVVVGRVRSRAGRRWSRWDRALDRQGMCAEALPSAHCSERAEQASDGASSRRPRPARSTCTGLPAPVIRQSSAEPKRSESAATQPFCW